ncbi:MAG: Fic family protein [Flavobacteriales bacterium]|jgi:Fic family protein|nr:Fic family protein [Flavobacteriales bacterium]MBK7102006.1 Fic family protein [Flavobacteriales bacterium]MBK7114357.1 Fic family protein [Flavobacteriales bacterium]MBK7483582.1 Fic family protein [Flavobacteriales bacterium]MBK7620959.1 Fic family protein [Flavobacteriales bacterium]
MDVASLTYYSISPRMLNLLATIHHRLGEVHARHLHKPAVDLEKAYHVSVVHSTLAIEGSTLDTLPVAELVDAHAAAPAGSAALEAVNTHRAYALLAELDPFVEHDLRHAHGVLMHGSALDAGHFRTGPMDVLYGDPEPLRTASAHDLPVNVQELLRYAEEDDFPPLLTSCVLHFGLVYLRPFTAGNGRLARLWQKRMLMAYWPVFAYLPVEAFIHRTQPAYYAALEYADRRGDCGDFIAYLLERIDEALVELLAEPDPVRSGADRIALFLMRAPDRSFQRKDYLNTFPELSTATASRDLAVAVASGELLLSGTKRQAHYRRRS